MDFPDLAPTSRTFNPGDWPVRTFRSQSGVESRVIYGDKRTNMTLDLTFENITDAQAEQFFDHYRSVLGTYNTFAVGSKAREGWAGSSTVYGASAYGNAYRYSEAPTINSVRPGISTVTVRLVGVL
jgi:hypothetical protein